MPLHRDFPGDSERVLKSKTRENFNGLIDRVGGLPEIFDGKAGVIIAVKSDETGIGEPTGPVHLSDQPVSRFKWREASVTASGNLDDVLHGGRVVRVTGSEAVTLTLDLTETLEDHVSEGFVCLVWNDLNDPTALVQIIFGTGTENRGPSGHTRIVHRGMAQIYVGTGGGVFFDGRTVA